MPTAKLKLHGSWRAEKRDAIEPKPPTGTPDAPTWLTEAGRLVWQQIVPLLEITPGLLTRVDGLALGRYCETVVRWLELSETIRKNGETYELHNEAGDIKSVQARPEVWIVNALAQQLSKLEASFGLTPSARAGLTINGETSTTAGGDEEEARNVCGY